MKVKLCGYPGCNALVQENNYYCPTHKAMADQKKKEIYKDTQRKSSSKYHSLYNSTLWRQTSKEFLKKYPNCFICGAKATIADHITPHRGNIELFYNTDNLQPMCWKCHSKKTLIENDFFSKGDGGSKN